MPRLTIITINYNNALGLEKTMKSVLEQTSRDFEYIVVDGGSTDSSCMVISEQLSVINDKRSENSDQRLVISDKWRECKINGISVYCISEPDNGIYHAMNKGIRMAKGEYVQFLNSGDVLAAPDVTSRMIEKLGVISSEPEGESSEVYILYGNMIKPYKGRLIHDKGFAGRRPTMLDFYIGTLNHSPAYIRRSLFECFGFYDESLKIVSDWKWYLQVIALHNIIPTYVDIDVTVFDMSGISSVNSELDKTERRKVLEDLLPFSVLADYDKFAFQIDQLKRLNGYLITKNIFWLLERVIFKWEKWKNNK